MQAITIAVAKLLPIVQENKAKYEDIYSTAVSGYWSKAEEILLSKVEQVKKQEKIDNYLNLTFPDNHSKDYERVIRMLELATEEKVTLTSNEFDAYVRNEWVWRSSFLGLCSGYVGASYGITGAISKF